VRSPIFIIISSLILTACANKPQGDFEASEYRQVNLEIPLDDLAALKNKSYITAMEAELLIKKYEVKEGRQPAELDMSPYDNGVARCGGVLIPIVVPGEEAPKFRVVGVTEEWIPIEGSVTKVLHLQMVNHW